MKANTAHENEKAASAAFGKQAPVFDEFYAENAIVEYKRDRVRTHVESRIQPASSILELNSGTGQDAVYFAQLGHFVHATDISEGMQSELIQKVKDSELVNKITYELCSFTELDRLKKRGPYDLVFSNFAGLNCTNDIEKVLSSLWPLLKSNGVVTLVLLPKFCLWETLLSLKGNFRVAFRRLIAWNGSRAKVEGVEFRCWYFSPKRIKRAMKGYELIGHEGLCTFVPPSYIDGFAEKYSGVFNWLKTLEARNAEKWPWKSIGDYYIISFRKQS